MPKFPPYRLSTLVIDVAKDWEGYPIQNIGAPPTDDDVLARGLVKIYSRDYGLNWADLGAIAGNFVQVMAYLGHGIVVLGDGNNHIWRSLDYGLTWNDQGVVTGANPWGIASLGNGIVLVGDLNGNVYRSTDYGTNWVDLGAGIGVSVHAIAYLGHGIAILGTANFHVWRSTDYGATWADLGVICTDDVAAMAYLGGGVAVLSDFDYHIWRSTDYGATWNDLGVIATNEIYGITSLGNGIAIMADFDGHVWRSTDYGATWIDLGALIGGVWSLSIAYLGGGVAVIGDINNHVFRSTDYGATWTDLGAITSNAINFIVYLDNGIALLGDDDNHVFRSVSAFGNDSDFIFEPSKILYPRFVYVKNTSGAGRAAGDVARHKAVAAGDEFDVPTANGEDSVLGMVAETIANNAYGYVQILGKTTLLSATNAGGNIAVGDFLCTENGTRARLAGAGDMAFARALEACAAANCTIDALLIKPMKI
jgi:photosystem II stability/assembly factor-like uncharacterized protein